MRAEKETPLRRYLPFKPWIQVGFPHGGKTDGIGQDCVQRNQYTIKQAEKTTAA